MELTNQCKDYFIQWYKDFEPKSGWKFPAYNYFLNHDLQYKITVLTGFFDSCEIFTKVVPHLGGGQPVFYGSVCFRNRQNIDCELDVENNSDPLYLIDRDEMAVLCLEMCNDIFNEINLPIEKEIKLSELDDLPF